MARITSASTQPPANPARQPSVKPRSNGKSTLIKGLMGMVTPESGEIVLETDAGRVDLVGKSTEEIVGLDITLVPEGRRRFPRLSVEEALAAVNGG